MWGYVTNIIGIGIATISVTCVDSGASTLTDGNGYYSLNPLMSGINLPITTSDSLGRYASQTKFIDFWGDPVRLDFMLSAFGTEVTVSNFHVNGH